MWLVDFFWCSSSILLMVANITGLGSNCLLCSSVSCLPMLTYPSCSCSATGCAINDLERPTMSLAGYVGELLPPALLGSS